MKIFLSGYYGNHNLGDDAILYVMLDNLNEVFKNPKINIETSDDEQYVKEHYRANKSKNWYYSILKSDLVIFGGGGLLSDDSGNYWKDLLPMMKKMLFAKLLGKKVLLIGIGVDIPHFRQTKIIYKIEGKSADLIVVRDSNSYKILKNLNVREDKLIKSYDLAILFSEKLNIINHQISDEIKYLKKPIIGINCFPYFQMKRDDSKQKIFNHEMLLFLNDLIAHYNASIVFLSASKGDYDTKDYVCMKNLFNAIQTDNKLIYNYENPFKTILFLKKCDYIIAMKLHMSLLGYTLNKKIVGISYNSKVKNFYEEIHRENYCIDLNNFSEKNAINIFKKIFEDNLNNDLLENMGENILEVYQKIASVDRCKGSV